MKKSYLSFLIIFILMFVLGIFYKGLNKSSFYEPKKVVKDIPKFSAMTFFEKEILNSKDIFNKDKFYLINIWASWCVPCRDEHLFLEDLSKLDKLEIIGINYKDNFKNAMRFINELGNPYSQILTDRDGTKAIEWGAYGVPESFLIYDNKIVKRIIGPLNIENVEEIKKFIK